MSARRLPVVLAEEARDDLESIALHGLLHWGEEQAERYRTPIDDVLDSLAWFPLLGQREGEVAGDVRSIAVGHHVILYRVQPDAVVVLRVLHERMDNGPQLDG